MIAKALFKFRPFDRPALRGFGQSALRLVFPPACLACRELVAEPGSLCGACWGEIKLIEAPWCPVLGTPFPHEVEDGAISPAAIADPPPFARARSAVVHTGSARKIAGDLKYRDRTDLAPWMAGWMMRVGRELTADADLIVPVPLHAYRLMTRRFNQSAELGRHVARLSGVPFAPQLVRRVKRTRQQVGLNAKARNDNVRGAFAVHPRHKPLLQGKRVLVVDDVYTTGATVCALAATLLRNGVSAVDVLTFSRALPDDRIDSSAWLDP